MLDGIRDDGYNNIMLCFCRTYLISLRNVLLIDSTSWRLGITLSTLEPEIRVPTTCLFLLLVFGVVLYCCCLSKRMEQPEWVFKGHLVIPSYHRFLDGSDFVFADEQHAARWLPLAYAPPYSL